MARTCTNTHRKEEKTTEGAHIRMSEIKNPDLVKCGWGRGATGTLTVCRVGVRNGTATLEKRSAIYDHIYGVVQSFFWKLIRDLKARTIIKTGP